MPGQSAPKQYIDSRIRRQGFGNQERDYVAFDNFQQIPAVAAAAVAVGFNQNFNLNGTGTETGVLATAANAGQHGGVLIGTSATTSDSAVLNAYAAPGTTFVGPWTPALTAQTIFDAVVRVTSIAPINIVAGLKLTSGDATGHTVSTDADQALFVFDTTAISGWNAGSVAPAASANWLAVVSVGGADFFVDTKVPVVAGKDYRLKIILRPDGNAQFQINNLPFVVATAAGAMTAGAALKPVIAVATRENVLKTLGIRSVRMQRVVPT